VKLKDFKKYLRGKAIDKLLHHARKSSQRRIVANEDEFIAPKKKARSAKRAAGVNR